MTRSRKTVQIFQTARDTADRLSRKADCFFDQSNPGHENELVNIHPEVVYQEIEGFGGAFTESGAVTLDKMSRKKRQEIIKAYFDPGAGLGYSLCRTHINSCDFSLGNYAYVEKPGDDRLISFSIAHDEKSLIPFIKEAKAARQGAPLKLFASPWSPPAWMKTTGTMNNGGKLKKKFRDAWARYIAKYVAAYEKKGIPIWGLTVQNEPKATQRWDSCVFTAEEERDFVKLHLGPVLGRSGRGNVKIMVWDHNKERIFERARTILSDAKAARYIWGVGFHWYSGDHFEGLAMTHEKFPAAKLLFTEGCVERGVKLGTWETGERYGHDIMGNLNNHAVGWVDWNMVLDETGGPNHVGNFCDAPIIANTKTDSIFRESSFYYIGHFSKFIMPGARRIGCSRYTDRLEVAAFRNPDRSIIVVALNRTDVTIPFNLRTRHGLAGVTAMPHSIVTMRY